ncbi:riboflavin kinase [Neophaeococcomyces mojaviensis]|uniref:Riboflavin kinase n=1 Tax=Neophaeococcomyces mojaviensis TaxID=3383035 RepID=A0ACC3A6N1_9EURO|nr:riboflavin kinase [Knufia sp. JES_112]
MRPGGPRDPYAGPESGPEPPFPIKLQGPVIKGFGRGSKELGIPTANIPPEGLNAYPDLSTGIYFGYTALLNPESLPFNPPSNTNTDSQSTSTSNTSLSNSSSTTFSAPSNPTKTSTTHPSAHNPHPSTTSIYPCVLSIGYNPFYANKTRSIEIHVLHKFHSDFYDTPLNLLMLGFIRPEFDYVSKESLIEDILTDCDVARRSLQRDAWRIDGKTEAEKEWEAWLRDFKWADGLSRQDVKQVEEKVLGGAGDGTGVEG